MYSVRWFVLYCFAMFSFVALFGIIISPKQGDEKQKKSIECSWMAMYGALVLAYMLYWTCGRRRKNGKILIYWIAFVLWCAWWNGIRPMREFSHQLNFRCNQLTLIIWTMLRKTIAHRTKHVSNENDLILLVTLQTAIEWKPFHSCRLLCSLRSRFPCIRLEVTDSRLRNNGPIELNEWCNYLVRHRLLRLI